MIRLELEQTTEPRSKWTRVGLAFLPFEIPYSPMVGILIMLVLAIGFKTAYGYRRDDPAWGMAGSRAGAERYEREHKKNYKHWRDVIAEVRRSGNGPLHVSDRKSANATTAIWLQNIRDLGTNVAIEGMSVSPAAVAELISNLQSTGYFSDIEIRETYQDDRKNKTDAFKFQLTCEVDRKATVQPSM